jgi:protease-4
MHNNSLNEQNITSDLINELIKERRSEKRWKNIRFFIILFFILFITMGFIAENNPTLSGTEDGKGYVALVRLDGMIAPGQDFSAETVVPLLHDAFSDTKAKGVILDINSGGGTPVQASIIHDTVLQLKKKYHKKVVVVGEDLLASGAYFVAVSADKIYVNPNTITGSIGVIMKGFGFTDLIKKVGVERRVVTSGSNKDRLDPFLPQTKEDLEKIHQVMSEIHENFDAVVKEGRQGKLQGDMNELFSGDFWSGASALKLGLVDHLGNLSDAMQAEFHVSRYKDYSQSQGILKALLGQVSLSLDKAVASTDLKMLEKIG